MRHFFAFFSSNFEKEVFFVEREILFVEKEVSFAEKEVFFVENGFFLKIKRNCSKHYHFKIASLNIFFQKSCIDFAINARPFATYIPPMHKHTKYKIWSMVVSQPFDYFIMLLIVLNTLLLMSKV